MQVEHLEVKEEDIGLVAQYVMAEAYDAYRHDNKKKYQRALEIGTALEGYAVNGTSVGQMAQLASHAQRSGLKSAQDISSLVAWMTFT